MSPIFDFAFDLLKENTNIARTVTGNEFTNTRSNNLTRYFLASVVFRFSKFVGNAPRQMNRVIVEGN